jgi:hypothetical protein
MDERIHVNKKENAGYRALIYVGKLLTQVDQMKIQS